MRTAERSAIAMTDGLLDYHKQRVTSILLITTRHLLAIQLRSVHGLQILPSNFFFLPLFVISVSCSSMGIKNEHANVER